MILLYYYYYYYYSAFFFNRRCNPCGLWPTQLSLSILSRKALQSAVASSTSNPQLEGPVIRTFQLSPQGVPSERTLAAEGGTMGEKWSRILPKVATSTSLLGSFTCRKFTTWDRGPYFPSEGRRAEDFFARTRELGYQKPARSPLDHRSLYYSAPQPLSLSLASLQLINVLIFSCMMSPLYPTPLAWRASLWFCGVLLCRGW